MNCTSPGCGRAWQPGQEFPLCITNPCPLRAHRDAISSQRVSWAPEKQRPAKLTRMRGDTDTSLAKIRAEVPKSFEVYSMKGKQKATTTVTLKNGTKKKFSTTTNMHSEMTATEWMLANGHWTLFLGMIVWADDWSGVTSAQFATGEPHCGFCTLMLQVLGLPLGTPTRGNYNLAGNFNYPLPAAVRESPYVMARVLDHGSYSGFHRIKRLLDKLISVPSDQWVLSIFGWAYVNENGYVGNPQGYLVLTWADIVRHENGRLLAELWRFVFQSIYATNNNAPSSGGSGVKRKR